MVSFYALLVLGTPASFRDHALTRYPIDLCTKYMQQDVDPRGRPTTRPYVGELHLTLPPPADVQLVAWAKEPFKAISGSVVFSDLDGIGPSMVLVLENAYCVIYADHFQPDPTGHVGYFLQLSIAAGRITKQGAEFLNHWGDGR